MPVYRYLDLSTAHLTEREMDAVQTNFAGLGDTPRVIVHEYGAWVHVQEPGLVDPDAEAAITAAYPAVAACLEYARAAECNWINFDQDADHHDGLPTYEW